MKRMILLALVLLMGCTKDEGMVQTGMAYGNAHRDDEVCVATVYLKDGVIQGATLDELTFLSKDEYEGLITGLETTTHKQIASKRENNEAYSQAMEINGSTKTIKENFDAICDYVVGKRVEDLERSDVDAITSCTLQSKQGYIDLIIEACRQAV